MKKIIITILVLVFMLALLSTSFAAGKKKTVMLGDRSEELFPGLFEQVGQSFLRVRHMAHIFSEDYIIVFIKHDKLDRSGSDIDPRTISIHVLFP